MDGHKAPNTCPQAVLFGRVQLALCHRDEAVAAAGERGETKTDNTKRGPPDNGQLVSDFRMRARAALRTRRRRCFALMLSVCSPPSACSMRAPLPKRSANVCMYVASSSSSSPSYMQIAPSPKKENIGPTTHGQVASVRGTGQNIKAAVRAPRYHYAQHYYSFNFPQFNQHAMNHR
uniref:Uncharacterized protein n=1 Tax=Panagrellus redivivus TaxID=6233 RepID=A0A7E4ZQN9_PANRE